MPTKRLMISTAICALAIALSAQDAHAACITVSTASTATISPASGDCINITSTGSVTADPVISGVYGAVTLTGITVDGRLEKTGPAVGVSLGAIHLDSTLTAASAILNGGISVSGTLSSAGRGIYLNDFTVNDGFTIEETGSIISSSLGINTVNTTIINSDIINRGLISSGNTSIGLSASGGVNGALRNYGTIFAPSIAINTSSTITGGITNYEGGNIIGRAQTGVNDFTNEGTFTNKINSSSSASAATGTASNSSVNNFVQSSTGLYQMAASGTAVRGTDYSSLTASGNAIVGGSVFIDVANSFTASTGDTLASVFQAGGAATNNITQITDNSLQYAFRAVMNGAQDIDFVITNTGITSIAGANTTGTGGTRSTRNAAHIIDGNSDLQEYFSEMTSATDVVEATKSTLPLLSGAQQVAVNTSLVTINRIVQARVEGSSGLSAGDEVHSDRYGWVKPFGSWADQNNKNGVDGYTARTGGVVIGMDGAVSNAARLGVSLAYANSNLKGKSSVSSNKADVDTYTLLGYGSYVLQDDLELNFQAGAGYSQTDGSRSLSFANSIASSDYDSWNATLGVGVGKLYHLFPTTTVTPSIRTDYTFVRADSYEETGAGVWNLNVDSKTNQQWIFEAGGKVDHQVTDDVRITANLGAGYDVLNSRPDIVAAYAGAPGSVFTSYGIKSDPWLGRGG
jgi:outer membrane autotransporter protein